MNPQFLAEQFILERPVEIRMEGWSMQPTLRADDKAIVSQCEDSKKIRVGDLVAFRSAESNLICHRVMKIESTDKGRIFTTKGDNNSFYDQSFTEKQIFGIIIAYKRKNKEKDINSLKMRFLRFAFLYFDCLARKVFRIMDKMRSAIQKRINLR